MVGFLHRGCQFVLPLSGSRRLFDKNLTNLCLTRTMEESTLSPPSSVRGMKKLDKLLFKKEIPVPCLLLPLDKIVDAKQVLKSYLLKMQNFRPIKDLLDDDGLVLPSDCNKILKSPFKVALLDPKLVNSYTDFKPEDREHLKKINLSGQYFITCRYTLNYDNWKADEVLRAVIPMEYESVSGYSLCGHIIHLNLRDQIAEYKQIIAEVLLDKVKCARTVVNKTDNIDSTFRTFSMELLAGDSNMVTTVRENKCMFTFDFSKVYWNPRLSTEHERIVSILKKGDVLYDVFCGVGPFAIPAKKKGCRVLANDLNPESIKWLKESMKLNKVEGIEVYNKDGKDFIKEDVRKDLLGLRDFAGNVHIAMNLPALAPTFVVHFKGLFTPDEVQRIPRLRIHVFCFTKGAEDPKAEAINMVESELGDSIQGDSEVTFVRNVAPLKEMMRVSFTPKDSVLSSCKRPSDLSPPAKRLHV